MTAFFALLAFLVAPSWAALSNVKLCFKYNVDLSDAAGVGDDYITDNAVDYYAYGAWIDVKKGATSVFSGYANDGTTGTPGCIPNFLVAGGTKLDVKLTSKNRVRGEDFYIYNTTSSGTLYSYAFTYTVGGSGTFTFSTTTEDWWSNAAVAAWAFYHNNTTGMADINIYMQDCGALVHGTCCEETGNKVFASAAGDSKFLLAHNLGHCVWTAEGMPELVDYSLSRSPCDYENAFPHTILSTEWQAANVWEGWAHFYEANTFNDGTAWVSNGQCYINHFDPPIDWDADGAIDATESDPIVSCAGSTNVENVYNYYNEWCQSSVASENENVGVALDWMREFWDFAWATGSAAFYSPDEILDVIIDSDPASWTESGYGSGPPGDGYPYTELWSSAEAISTDVRDKFIYYAGWNGVDQ